MFYRQEDMPFTKDGIVPDIIMNPHAVPSRMTIAQLMECLMGKTCTVLGTYGDATPFTDLGVEDIANLLQDQGYDRYGNEILYNPITGEQINTLVFIGPTFYQRLKHMTTDKIHCLTSDHEVLTSNGWKQIDEVTKEDKVATLKDNKIVYDNPTNVLHFPNYSGKMYHVKNQMIDLDVTINHRMYVSKQGWNSGKRYWKPHTLVTAEDIMGKPVKYKKNGEWDCPDYQFILPAVDKNTEELVDMDAWLTFMGIWFAEGWANASQKCTDYKVSFSVNKQRVKDALYPAVTKLGYNFSVNREKLQIHNKQLYTYMLPLSVGAPNKTLPSWCFQLSQMQTRQLIHAMMLGDGCFNKNTSASMYYTTSNILADQFMQLCLHAGWSSNKSMHYEAGHRTTLKDGRDIIGKNIVWRLAVIKHKNTPEVNHGHHKMQNVQEEYTYDYEGSVFCLQVPSEVFYVRRNGKAVWTGNSRSANGPIVQLTRQPAEGRAREGGLRIGEMEVECNLAHGVSSFLKERLVEMSDNYRVFVCKKCGLIANCNPEKGVYACKPCRNTTQFSEIRIPYSAKLLFQEMQTMSIGTRFITQ